jgi:hypothetical protein
MLLFYHDESMNKIATIWEGKSGIQNEYSSISKKNHEGPGGQVLKYQFLLTAALSQVLSAENSAKRWLR